jgi:hypothetical protein
MTHQEFMLNLTILGFKYAGTGAYVGNTRMHIRSKCTWVNKEGAYVFQYLKEPTVKEVEIYITTETYQYRAKKYIEAIRYLEQL